MIQIFGTTQSAYAHMCGEEPPYSNYTDMFKGTLDYIWYTIPHLRPLAVVSVPSEDDIKRSGRSMPNVSASSDHVLLCADMQVNAILPMIFLQHRA
jgi:mRNA deadenylase 3'-5' endonuclease subunit Ccr4